MHIGVQVLKEALEVEAQQYSAAIWPLLSTASLAQPRLHQYCFTALLLLLLPTSKAALPASLRVYARQL